MIPTVRGRADGVCDMVSLLTSRKNNDQYTDRVAAIGFAATHKQNKQNKLKQIKIMKTKNQKQVKLADIRQEIKKEKGTVSHCIKVVCALAETCPQLKSVCPTKKDFLALAQTIYAEMKVGEQVVTVRCTYTRKCSVDMVIRWLLKRKK